MAQRGRASMRRFLSVLLPVTALSGLILATSAGGASAASTHPVSPAAAAGFPAPAWDGVSTEIVLDNGGYKKCLNYQGGQVTAGTKVELWTCNSNDVASQWLTSTNDTISPYKDDSMAVTSVNGQLVLEPIDGAAKYDNWYFSANGEIVSEISSPPDSPAVLNDPGYRTANGTQLISYQQGAVTDNAHWYVPKAHYATSRLTGRPDTGGNGVWATDTITRQSMVIYTGPDGPLPHPGSYQFDASVVDSGVFTTVPEAYTPNQDNPQGLPSAPTLGPNPLSGEITGHAFYRFDFPSFVGQAPAAAYSGADQPSTLNWPLLYFVGGDQYTLSADDNLFTDGAEQQDWKYVSIMDGCGQFEIWTEAGYDNLGQSADAGNITAASGSGCSS